MVVVLPMIVLCLIEALEAADAACDAVHGMRRVYEMRLGVRKACVQQLVGVEKLCGASDRKQSRKKARGI